MSVTAQKFCVRAATAACLLLSLTSDEERLSSSAERLFCDVKLLVRVSLLRLGSGVPPLPLSDVSLSFSLLPRRISLEEVEELEACWFYTQEKI